MKSKIINFFNKYINVILILITFFIACGLNIFFIQEGNYLKLSSESYNILFLIFIIGIFILLKKAMDLHIYLIYNICNSLSLRRYRKYLL